MYLALTYDHRMVDGREAVTFLCTVRDQIEEPAAFLSQPTHCAGYHNASSSGQGVCTCKLLRDSYV
eukprot:1989929-Amphidinium_carterae.1